MTNQQGAPEALRPITRYEVVDCIDSKHVPAVIPNKDGPWVRYEDHLAALVEAQQPATHVQKPAGIEHVAGDVSKNGPESNMAQQPSHKAPQQEAQEPCPTCAALARTVMCDQVSFDRKPDCYGIRQITDDEGIEEWEDIRTSPDVAREEANDMMATGRGEIYEVVPLWTTPQPSPTPQADSQPEDENDAHNFAICQHFDNWLIEKGALLTPHSEESDGPMAPALNWIASVEAMVAANTQADSQPAPVLDESAARDECKHKWLAEDEDCNLLEAYDRGWKDRAARAPADSVTAPAGGANWAQLRSALAMLMLGWGRNPNQTMDACYRVLDSATEPGTALAILRTAPDWRSFMAADRAKADSVLEDAARLERERICAAIKAEDDYCVDQGDYMLDSDDCIKIVRGEWVRPDFAIDAARKQGGAT